MDNYMLEEEAMLEETVATIEVTPDQPIPVQYVPDVWSTIQSGAYAIIIVAVVIWLRYGGKVVDYLDNQKEIQASLLELHRDNQSNKQTTDARLSRLEQSIERMLLYLTQDYRSVSIKRVEQSELDEMRQNHQANQQERKQ